MRLAISLEIELYSLFLNDCSEFQQGNSQNQRKTGQTLVKHLSDLGYFF